MDKKWLLLAIEKAGGQTKIADALGITQGHIGKWISRDRKAPPAEYVLKIEEVTGISRHKLRPDVFGEEKEA